MEDVKIVLSYNGKQRYVSYKSVVMGSNTLGPMTPEDAEHLVSALKALAILKRLDREILIVHLDIGGDHRYALGRLAHKIITEAKALLFETTKGAEP